MTPMRPTDAQLDSLSRRPKPALRLIRRLRSYGIERLVGTVLGWTERRRQRRALLSLSNAMLKDIGLSRADVEREAEKPFWRP